jgi:hypothetical protein
MTEKNYKQADMKHDKTRDQLDDILDAALAKYAAVEPRIGLEDRVLANLRAEGAQAVNITRWRWWQWTTTAAVAAGIVVAVFAWRSVKPSHPAIANRPSITTPARPEPNPEQPPTQLAQDRSGNSNPLRTAPITTRHPNSAVVATAPKLAVFPSPQPLNEQEKLLANYVSQFHDQAVLIARVTNEELKRDRIEVLGNSESFPENPDQVADQPITNR